MNKDQVSLGDVKRGQQQLRDHIAESDRLIGEAEQRVATSRAYTASPNESGAEPPAAAEI